MTQQYQYTLQGLSDNVQLGKGLNRIKSLSTGFQFRDNADSAFVSLFGLGIGVNAGSLSSPSFFFNGDTDTGFYSPGANTVTVVTGGVSSVEFRDPSTGTTFVANGTGSITIPSGTTAQRPSSPSAGMFRLNTSTNQLEFHTGSSWDVVNTQSSNSGFPDGTASSPSGYFINDVDTGFYRPTTNQFGISAGGALRLNVGDTQVQSTVVVRGVDGTASDPSFSFSSETGTGIYRVGSNQLGISVGSNQSAVFRPGNTTANSVVTISGNTSLTVPVGTTAQRPSTPTAGMVRFNSTLSDLEYYDGTNWINVSSSFSGFADGTASSPGAYFASDTDTGMFRPAANQIGFSAGGVQSLLINQTTSDSVITIFGNTSFTVPIGTTAQRPSTPTAGMVRFNSTLSDLEYYNGSAWVQSSSFAGFSDGSAASPSIYFSSDTDTGFYRPAANQVGVSAGGVQSLLVNSASVTADSVLVVSGNTSLTVPVGTTAQRPSTPTAGMVRFNSTLSDLEYYDGTSWITVSSSFSGFADGTASSPGAYFASDTDTGMFRPAANQIGFSAGGVQSLLINQTTSDSVAVFSGNTSLTVPVGTTAQRPSTPTAGMVRFNSTLSDLEYYDGTNWLQSSSFYGFVDGTVTSPGAYFASDTDTGFYRPAANQIGVSTNGAQRALITTTEISTSVPVTVPNGTVTTPSYSFNTETNTGFYLSGANQISVAINGANSVIINSAATTTDAVASFVGTSAIRIPSGTTAQRPSTPAQGMVRYNTTSNTTEIYDGSAWQNIGSSSSTSDGSTLILIARNFV